MLVNDAWDDVLRSDFLDVCDVLSMGSPISPEGLLFWAKAQYYSSNYIPGI